MSQCSYACPFIPCPSRRKTVSTNENLVMSQRIKLV